MIVPDTVDKKVNLRSYKVKALPEERVPVYEQILEAFPGTCSKWVPKQLNVITTKSN